MPEGVVLAAKPSDKVKRGQPEKEQPGGVRHLQVQHQLMVGQFVVDSVGDIVNNM